MPFMRTQDEVLEELLWPWVCKDEDRNACGTTHLKITPLKPPHIFDSRVKMVLTCEHRDSWVFIYDALQKVMSWPVKQKETQTDE